MSALYLVAAPPEAGWKLDLDTFAEWLISDWPGATAEIVQLPPMRAPVLDFEVSIDGDPHEGHAHSDSVSMRNPSVEGFARFAIWVRDKTGGAAGLVACRASDGSMVPLEPDTTVEDVVAALTW